MAKDRPRAGAVKNKNGAHPGTSKTNGAYPGEAQNEHDRRPGLEKKALRRVEQARASFIKAEERVAAVRARLARAEEKLMRRAARLSAAEELLAALAAAPEHDAPGTPDKANGIGALATPGGDDVARAMPGDESVAVGVQARRDDAVASDFAAGEAPAAPAPDVPSSDGAGVPERLGAEATATAHHAAPAAGAARQPRSRRKPSGTGAS